MAFTTCSGPNFKIRESSKLDHMFLWIMIPRLTQKISVRNNYDHMIFQLRSQRDCGYFQIMNISGIELISL